LPEEYITTTNNQQFLQYDNGQNAENRMLVFYSPGSLECLYHWERDCVAAQELDFHSEV
jgi:hypothetical protein